MEMRFLGKSGLKVSILSFGTMTFGGSGDFFQQVGSTQLEEAQRLVDICLDAGVNLFDTADVYPLGHSEEILGKVLGNRRQDVIVATKAFARLGGPNDVESGYHLIRACEDSLRRLGTDYIDLYQVHSFNVLIPLEETLRALNDLVRSGKVRYIGCSNYSAWQLMKALCVSKHEGLERYVSQQVYYSLTAQELEYELVPLGLEQGVGTLVWSPLAFGFLSSKYRRNQPAPEGTSRSKVGDVGKIDLEKSYDIVEALDDVANAHGVTIAQAALNWLLRKHGVTSVIIGARNEQQLRDNLNTATWEMTPDQVRRIDEVSAVPPIYPYWQQQQYAQERIPKI